MKLLLLSYLINNIISFSIMVGPSVYYNENETIESYVLFEHIMFFLESRVNYLIDNNHDFLNTRFQDYNFYLENIAKNLIFEFENNNFKHYYVADQKKIFDINNKTKFVFHLKVILNDFDQSIKMTTLVFLFQTIDFTVKFNADLQFLKHEKKFDILRNFWPDFLIFFSRNYNFKKNYYCIKEEIDHNNSKRFKNNSNLSLNKYEFTENYFLDLKKYIMKCFKWYYIYKKNQNVYDFYDTKIKDFFNKKLNSSNGFEKSNFNNHIAARKFYFSVSGEEKITKLNDLRTPYFSVDSILILLYSNLLNQQNKEINICEEKRLKKIYININNQYQFFDYMICIIKDISFNLNLDTIFYSVDNFLEKALSFFINLEYPNYNYYFLNKNLTEKKIQKFSKYNEKIQVYFLFERILIENRHFEDYFINKNLFNIKTGKKLYNLLYDSFIVYRKIFVMQIHGFIKTKKIKTLCFEGVYMVNISHDINNLVYNDLNLDESSKIVTNDSIKDIILKQTNNIIRIKNLILKHFHYTLGNDKREFDKFLNEFNSFYKEKWNAENIIRKILEFV